MFYAIVLVNYKKYDDTLECLESILKSTYKKYHIFIVDNSDDLTSFNTFKKWTNGEYNEIKTAFKNHVFPLIPKPIDDIAHFFNETDFKIEAAKKINFIKASNNGFGAANNIVLNQIASQKTPYNTAWMLNTDIVIEDNVLTNINNSINGINNTLFGTVLKEYYKPNRVQAIGGKFYRLTGRTANVGGNTSIESLTKKESIDYPIGASMLISKDHLINVGTLSEDYFLFYEEMDYVERIKPVNGSVKILYIDGVYHKQGGATGIKQFQPNKYVVNSRVTFMKKYYPKHLFTTIAYNIISNTIKRVIVKIRKN